MQFLRARANSIAALIALCFTPATVAAGLIQSTVFLQPGGTLSGQAVDGSDPWITVAAGQQITGTVNVRTTIDPYYSYAVAPLGYTATWGDRTTQAVLSYGWIGTGTNDYAITIDKTAPLDPGIYYIPIAFSYEFTIDQVMSATNWAVPSQPVWGDGNDLGWDWVEDQYVQAQQFGYITQSVLGYIIQDATGWDGTYSTLNHPATWIGVRVVPEPSSLALLSAGLLALGFLRRCNLAR